MNFPLILILSIAIFVRCHERSLLQQSAFTPLSKDITGVCYTGQDEKRTLKIGVVADNGFIAKVGQANLQDTVDNYIAKTNEIYEGQLGFTFELLSPIVQIAGSAEPWNQLPTLPQTDQSKPNLCPNPTKADAPMTNTEQFELFRTWKAANHPSDAGIWILLTDCQPGGNNNKPGTSHFESVCTSGGSTAMVSFADPNLRGIVTASDVDTWRWFARTLAVNFGGMSMQNPAGLMGTGNYFYPKLLDERNKPASYLGRVQFSPSNGPNLCAFLDELINNPTLTNGGNPLNTVPCFSTVTTYQWQTVNCTKNPPTPCTCYCSPLGQGVQTSVYKCKLATAPNGVDQPESNCPVPKPWGNQEPCNYPALNNNQQCPGLGETGCVGGQPNGLVEGNEECDLGNGANVQCCSNCKRVKTDVCTKIVSARDAAFNDFTNLSQYFVFQSGSWAMFDDINTQTIGSFNGKAYPLPVATYFRNLDTMFNTGIDAIIQAPDEVIYFFKGDKVSKYELCCGQLNNYPMLISNTQWRTVTFSDGPITAENPIDAAVSLKAGAFIFRGTEFVIFNYGQLQQSAAYPQPLGFFGLSPTHFKAGVSAALHYWGTDSSQGSVDFFSATGFRQRWEFGNGVQGGAIQLSALGVTTSTNANTLTCPMNCNNCVVVDVCEVCAADYNLVSGVCYKKAFLLELFFEDGDYTKDQQFIKDSSFQEADWNLEYGVIGKGVGFVRGGTSYINLKPPSVPLKDFSFVFWIKFTEIRSTPIVTATLSIGGVEVAVQINCQMTNSQSYTVAFQMGSSFVQNNEPLPVGVFEHIIVKLENNIMSITANGVSNQAQYIPDNPQQGNAIYFDKISIGSSVNSWYGVMDEFHIDNLNIDATNQFIKLNGSPIRFSLSWILICLLVIASCIAL